VVQHGELADEVELPVGEREGVDIPVP